MLITYIRDRPLLNENICVCIYAVYVCVFNAHCGLYRHTLPLNDTGNLYGIKSFIKVPRPHHYF